MGSAARPLQVASLPTGPTRLDECREKPMQMSDAIRDNRRWHALAKRQASLSDEEFLEEFQPLLEYFEARAPYLEKFAQRLGEIYDLTGLSILEPACGADVFPSLLRRRGDCRVRGLEAAQSPAARYCRLRELPIITTPDWKTWTDEIFELVVVTGYITSPYHSEWGREMAVCFCRSALYQIEGGAELVLFDTRYAGPMVNAIRSASLAIEWRRYRGPHRGAVIFYRAGMPRASRIESPPEELIRH